MRLVKTVAILSPYFPPATLAGVHRARHLAKHLPAHGWRPIVLRVDEEHYTERLDPALAALVPASVEQLHVGAVSARLARRFGIGDLGLRGYFALKAALSALAGRERLDAVLITGSPFYPMLLSRFIREELGLPVVLDFQDPWVSAEGARRPPRSKGGLAHRFAVTLEPRAVRHATFITGITDEQNAEMADRYPFIDRRRMAAIPIGGDPDDFEALRRNPPSEPEIALDSAHINFSYVGTFLPRAVPVIKVLFAAVASLRARQPTLAAKLRMNFVGTSNQPSGIGTHLVLPQAEAEGVEDLVREHPARVPYLEALSLLAHSHGILMIGSDEPHYSASKIYPGLMSGTPYLALFHEASSAYDILARSGGGRVVGFNNETALKASVPTIAGFLEALAIGSKTGWPELKWDILSDYTASSVAARFADVLNMITNNLNSR